MVVRERFSEELHEELNPKNKYKFMKFKNEREREGPSRGLAGMRHCAFWKYSKEIRV